MIVLFEGLDGSGKSTIAKLLHTETQPVSRAFAFPTRQGPGAVLRSIFANNDEVSENAVLSLLVADALLTQPEVLQGHFGGSLVILDRHVLISALVYQAHVLGLTDVFEALRPVRMPIDWTFIVDVPADVAKERVSARGDKNPRYEKELASYERMRKRYLGISALAPWGNTRVLDGLRDPRLNVADVRAMLVGW